MELNLLEEFTLLSLDDDKGTFLTDSFYFNMSISGCVLLHLTLAGKIALDGKKIKVTNNEPDDNQIINQLFEEIINSKKERGIEHWLSHFETKSSKIINDCIGGLIDKGILSKQENKFLWVFTQKKYPTENASPENELKLRLQKIAEGKKKPTERELILLNLINTCEIGNAVFGKDFYKRHKANLKDLIKADNISNTLQKELNAMQDEIISSIVALSTAAIVTTIIIN